MYLYIYTYFCNACTRLSTSSTILYVYSTNSIPGSIFSPFFKTTDVFSEWWKLPEDVQFAILPSGRSGFGRSPFVQSRNELLLRLLLPASMSNMEGGEPEAFFLGAIYWSGDRRKINFRNPFFRIFVWCFSGKS